MLNATYEKYEHLIGTQINKWTVLDFVDKQYKNKNLIYAKCQCSCGTIRNIRLSKLLNNKCIDCGCGTKERMRQKIIEKYKHLIGTTINEWTILKVIPPDDEHRSTCVLCQCSCGTIKETQLQYVLHGQSKSCGCLQKKMLQNRCTKSLIGQRFGKLTVVEMLEERNKFKRIMYKCKCDCGGEIITSSSCLKNHYTSSCGCIVSHGNTYISKFLLQNNIEYKTEYGVKIDNRTYRFDFYLPKFNLFIEFDGSQHYKPARFGGISQEKAEEGFKHTQKSDQIKNNYCMKHNIHLLRIPYWEIEHIETIINNYLQRLSEEGFVEAS